MWESFLRYLEGAGALALSPPHKDTVYYLSEAEIEARADEPEPTEEADREAGPDAYWVPLWFADHVLTAREPSMSYEEAQPREARVLRQDRNRQARAELLGMEAPTLPSRQPFFCPAIHADAWEEFMQDQGLLSEISTLII
jgi:hypothetical protein